MIGTGAALLATAAAAFPAPSPMPTIIESPQCDPAPQFYACVVGPTWRETMYAPVIPISRVKPARPGRVIVAARWARWHEFGHIQEARMMSDAERAQWASLTDRPAFDREIFAQDYAGCRLQVPGTLPRPILPEPWHRRAKVRLCAFIAGWVASAD